jgi:hypothetical protein
VSTAQRAEAAYLAGAETTEITSPKSEPDNDTARSRVRNDQLRASVEGQPADLLATRAAVGDDAVADR